MKKNYLQMLVVLMTAILSVGIMSCSKDDDGGSSFNYPIEDLYGTWKISQMKTSESSSYKNWILTTTTATFYSNGTYSGHGYFGNGSGTYTAKGNTITTFVEGQVYITYTVLSLSGSTVELKLSQPGSSSVLGVKCVKQ